MTTQPDIPGIHGERPRLRFLEGSLRGLEIELAADEVVIGRARDCSLPVDPAVDRLVSGRHAKLRHTDGQWWLTDLGSSNGTWRNAQRIADPVPLHNDDEIMLGVPETEGTLVFAFVMMSRRTTNSMRRSSLHVGADPARPGTLSESAATIHPAADHAVTPIAETKPMQAPEPMRPSGDAALVPRPVAQPISQPVAQPVHAPHASSARAAGPIVCPWCHADRMLDSRDVRGAEPGERICARCRLAIPGGYAWDDPRWKLPWLVSTGDAFIELTAPSPLEPDAAMFRWAGDEEQGLVPRLWGRLARWSAERAMKRRVRDLAMRLGIASARTAKAAKELLAATPKWPEMLAQEVGLAKEKINAVDAPFELIRHRTRGGGTGEPLPKQATVMTELRRVRELRQQMMLADVWLRAFEASRS